MARRWRQDPGLPTDKWDVKQRDGWFYATPKPKKPKAGKPAPKKKLPPLEFLGDPSLRGAFAKEPALNPNEWLSTQGRDGRYYAVRQTELTGLGPQYTAQVRDFDTQTSGQATRIGDAGNAQAAAAEASAARDRQALADYARNTGVVVNPSDPTAAAVARAMGQSNAAAGGPEVVRGLDMPAVLRASAASNVERFRAQRGTDRATMITAMRSSIAEETAARQQAAAELRGQNLQLLSSLSGQDASTQRALLSGQVALSGQQAANQRAELSAETSARNTDVREAGQNARTEANLRAARNRDAAKLKAAKFTPETRRMLAEKAQTMVRGVPSTRPDGTKGVLKYSFREVVQWLVAAGAPRAQAEAIARGAGATNRLFDGAAGSANVGPARPAGGTEGGGF